MILSYSGAASALAPRSQQDACCGELCGRPGRTPAWTHAAGSAADNEQRASAQGRRDCTAPQHTTSEATKLTTHQAAQLPVACELRPGGSARVHRRARAERTAGDFCTPATPAAAHATHGAWAPLWQVRGLPRLLRGEDTLCCAQTGSGKTLLFLLPILRQLFGPPPSREPRIVMSHKFDDSRPKKPKRGHIPKTVLPSAPDALVLVHSRELALQIAHVARSLAAGLPGRLDDRVCCLTNGAAYTPQRAQLRGGGVRLVATTYVWSTFRNDAMRLGLDKRRKRRREDKLTTRNE